MALLYLTSQLTIVYHFLTLLHRKINSCNHVLQIKKKTLKSITKLDFTKLTLHHFFYVHIFETFLTLQSVSNTAK